MSAARETYLEWPEGWPRTPDYKRARGDRFRNPTLDAAQHDVRDELRRLGASAVRVSIDAPTRRDGLAYASGPQPKDPGVACYFMLRGKPHVMACDTYRTAPANLRALALTIASLRSIERHGASGILDRAMAGFAALPPGAGAAPVRPWWDVLNIPQIDGVRFEEIGGDPRHPMRAPILAMAESLYRSKVVQAHPDRGGSNEAMAELGRAIAECRAALGKVARDEGVSRGGG